MEPFTGATAFATVVSLIAQFRAERAATKSLEAEEFMNWLSDSKHSELRALLEQNASTSVSIKSLLSVNQRELIEKLENLDSALAAYASALPQFKDLVASIRPKSVLSEQAVSILKQLEKSGGSKILEMPIKGNIILQIMDGGGGFIDANDQRFLEDDLRTLVETGLLNRSINPSGNNLYSYTRAASQYVASIDDEL
jgi:hypothetical protein